MSNRSIKKRFGSGKKCAPDRAQIQRALAAGDIQGAASLAELALSEGMVDTLALNLAAWRREETGDFAAAHQFLRRALAIAPGDVMILGSIGAVLRKQGFWKESLEVLDRVVAVEPRHSAAWLERGYVLDALRMAGEAVASYQRALAIDPYLAPALGKLADSAAKSGDGEVGRDYAARALAIDPLQPAAIFALATISIEARDGARAEGQLRGLLASTLQSEDRIRTLTLLGDALDLQDRPSEAFAAYAEAQHLFAKTYAELLAPSPERPSHRDYVDRIRKQVAATGPLERRYLPTDLPGAAATHVFLLGYPRSGTTLVENVLASAPGVVALEERDTLADSDEALLANDGTMPELDLIDQNLVDRLRAGYWSRVQAMAGEVAGKIFVDMNPFNGSKLPIISRLFPDSRIVIMRRDPRDVVLSCFRVNFAPSAATYTFCDLAETARHYDAMMRLIELARKTLPLAFHEVRYDRLVRDFEPTVRELAAFIGIAWTDAFRAFDRTAKARGVGTASATQVRRGLYDGGGKWRRYEAQLAPVLPILEPWIERFGFSQ